MDEEEDDAHEETDAANDNVGDAQEGVLPAKDAHGRDDHALGSLELRHLKVVANLQPVGVVCSQALTLPEGSIFAIQNFPVKLSEVGECGSTHPDNQIFVLESIVVLVCRVEFPHLLLPVLWLDCTSLLPSLLNRGEYKVVCVSFLGQTVLESLLPLNSFRMFTLEIQFWNT